MSEYFTPQEREILIAFCDWQIRMAEIWGSDAEAEFWERLKEKFE
jgi:hypothetical protein